MKATVGDKIVIRGHYVGEPDRDCVILDVRGTDGGPPYLVHWEDSERAMRLRQPLRYSWMPRVLTGGIAVIAVCGGIVAVVDRLVH